jgi:5-hydroxyisourate hydrolase-like protein (transthyretin family)
MGRLTTHVLDTALGQPATGLRLTVWAVNDAADIKTALKTVETNLEGRTPEPCWRAGSFKRAPTKSPMMWPPTLLKPGDPLRPPLS